MFLLARHEDCKDRGGNWSPRVAHAAAAETVRWLPKELDAQIIPGPSKSTPRIQRTENRCSSRCTQMFTAVLFTTAKGWKQPKCSSAAGVRSRQEEALPSVQGPGVHWASPCPPKPRGSPVNGAGLWPGAVGGLG